MYAPVSPTRSAADRFAALPSLLLFFLFFLAVAVGHLTLLRLPYFWDEGGYYVPAALDFLHRGTLIPEFTNAHPPLPNVVLGTWWHLTGSSILSTRLLVCAVTAAALLAVFRLGERLLNPAGGVALATLTAVYPIWYAQSTLAHADIFAAAFTLWALAVALPEAEVEPAPGMRLWLGLSQRQWLVAGLLSSAVMSKETAIVQPAALAVVRLCWLIRDRTQPDRRTGKVRWLVRGLRPTKSTVHHLRWLAAFSLPVLPLLAWYAYHRARTGFTFGNPEYLRYNATANLNAGHIALALYYRLLHLVWQRNIWLPLLITVVLLVRRWAVRFGILSMSVGTLQTIATLVAANWLAFSVLGGALLTRYLLPVYPLILLVCLAMWRSRTRRWPWLAAATGAVFVSAWWLNPPQSFAPEDNLTYRDMIVVHQEAAAFAEQHFPDATVLTAWPVAADLTRPELGYVQRKMRVTSVETFSASEIAKAAQMPSQYDTAIVFATHYLSPWYQRFLMAHPDTWRGRQFAANRDLMPAEIARLLGGRVVWQDDRNGEWAAVLRFDRSYEARLQSSSASHLALH